MSATLNGADRKLFSFSDRDNMPPVALLAKNLLIHISIVLRVNTSSRASSHGVGYTSSSAQRARANQY